MNIQRPTLICLFIVLLTCVPLSLSWALGPGETVVQTIDQGLKILEDPSLQGMDQFTERKERLWAILTPVFDFDETSKRALGHHWKNISPKEHKEFVSVFTQVLRDIYIGKTDSYTGGSFIYIREIIQDTRGKVRTNFITTSQKTVVVDFSMHDINNVWKVYDITIEGVSIVGNYRSQFNSILSDSSFEDLMERLRNKRDEFNQ